jgi:G3E family GTPase
LPASALACLSDADRLRIAHELALSPFFIIFRKQFQEADLIVVNKTDLPTPSELCGQPELVS